MSKNIISKEIFNEIISELQRVDDYHFGLNAYFEKSGVQGFLYAPDATSSVMQLLKAMFNDEDDLINVFCGEMDYGRKYKSGYLKDEAGYHIDFSTPDLLYDYLVDKM